MVVDEDLIMLGEFGNLENAPRRQADAGAGDEHERIALAVELVIYMDAVDLDFSALDRPGRFHRVYPRNVTISNPKLAFNDNPRSGPVLKSAGPGASRYAR